MWCFTKKAFYNATTQAITQSTTLTDRKGVERWWCQRNIQTEHIPGTIVITPIISVSFSAQVVSLSVSPIGWKKEMMLFTFETNLPN